MGFNGFVSSEMNTQATRCASEFAKITDPRATGNGSGLAERTRIAQDLHDTLLQGFFAVSMQLQAAVNDLPADSTIKSRFDGVVQLMDQVLEAGRLTVQGLRSPQEYAASLGQALAGVPAELGLPPDKFRVVVEGRQRELKSGLGGEIYHIGREAIVNAYRHSGAEDIQTQIEYRPGELRIAVRDNGCGISPQQLQWGRSGHWGLQGMRERAERIGARLRVLSRIALGTEVELCIPGRLAFKQSGLLSRSS